MNELVDENNALPPALEAMPVDLWDRTNERSVLNLVPPGTANLMIEAGRAKPELFTLDERTLWKTLRAEESTPSPTDNRLRLAFWAEYDRAQGSNDRMNMNAVFGGICTRPIFDKYLSHPEKMAWMLCPPALYMTVMEEALSFGIERIRDILEIDVVRTVKGKEVVDVKLGELQAKIVAMLELRVKGAVATKIEQRNMNLNINTSDKQVAKAAMGGSMADIQKRLKELERRDRMSAPPREAVDVTEDTSQS
jgi:hypothetical protein